MISALRSVGLGASVGLAGSKLDLKAQCGQVLQACNYRVAAAMLGTILLGVIAAHDRRGPMLLGLATTSEQQQQVPIEWLYSDARAEREVAAMSDEAVDEVISRTLCVGTNRDIIRTYEGRSWKLLTLWRGTVLQVRVRCGLPAPQFVAR